jgi:hypothetical protein
VNTEFEGKCKDFILVGCILLRYVHLYPSNIYIYIYPRSQLRIYWCYFALMKHNKTLLPHSQLNMCIYRTRTLTTCFGFNEPSSGNSIYSTLNMQAKCYKLYKSLKLVLKHTSIRSYKINP